MSWLRATAHLSASPHIRSPHSGLSRGSWLALQLQPASESLSFVGHVPSTEVATLLAIDGSGCPPTHPSIQQSTYPASIHPPSSFFHICVWVLIYLSTHAYHTASQPSVCLSAHTSIHPSSHHPSNCHFVCIAVHLSVHPSVIYPSADHPESSLHPSAHLSVHCPPCFPRPLPLLGPDKAHVLTAVLDTSMFPTSSRLPCGSFL